MHKDIILNKLIDINKPIPIERFIELSLYGKDGYYINASVVGSSGDFITSPEISQLFGEIIGLYILNYWEKNIKKKFNLLELGPGNGTLLLDILRITKRFNEFNKAINIQIVEKNLKLIEKQKNNFRGLNFNIKKINWSTDFKENYKDPIIILANEFFDCFPIKQFYKKNDIWYQKMVKCEPIYKDLKLVDIKVNNKKTLKDIQRSSTGNILELSKSRENYFSKICKKIKAVNGMMIAIDYGYIDSPKNFTLQSVYNNKYSNVLDNIGNQDITSLVDFKSLIRIAKSFNLKLKVFSTQRDFLIQNGIYERADQIIKNCKKDEKENIISGLNRIIDVDNMGSLFKVLIVSK